MGNIMSAPPSPAKTVDKEKSEESMTLPPKAIEVWSRVAATVANDDNENVNLDGTIKALQLANEYFESHSEAREFVTNNVQRIIRSLVSSMCVKEDSTVHKKTEECLKLSATIAAKFLKLAIATEAVEDLIVSLTLFQDLFTRDNVYYQETEGKESRIRAIDAFQCEGGFFNIAVVLSLSLFDSASETTRIDVMLCVSDAIIDLAGLRHEKQLLPFMILINSLEMRETTHNTKKQIELLLDVARDIEPKTDSSIQEQVYYDSTHQFVSDLDERKVCATVLADRLVELIRGLQLEGLRRKQILSLEKIIDNVQRVLQVIARQIDACKFQDVHKDLTLRLISSENAELSYFGWWQLAPLALFPLKYVPPSTSFTIANAERSHVNGTYKAVSEDRFVQVEPVKTCVVYCSIVSCNGEMTICWQLTSCVESSVSGNEEVYYTHNYGAEGVPMNGWISKDSKESTLNVSFTDSLAVPQGAQCDTLDHRLAKWAISNRLIERFLERDWSAGVFDSLVSPMSIFLKVFRFVNKHDTSAVSYNTKAAFRLQGQHILQPWNKCLQAKEECTIRTCCELIAKLLFVVPESIVVNKLIPAIRESLDVNPKNACFFLSEVSSLPSSGGISKRPVSLSYLSVETRMEIKRLVWCLRVRMLDNKGRISKDMISDGWFVLETFRPPNHQSIIHQSLSVSVVDVNTRLIQVSVPIECSSGAFFVEMEVFASSDGNEDVTLVKVGRDAIEQCLIARQDRVTLDVALPEHGKWSIYTQGSLIGSMSLVKAPRSEKVTISIGNIEVNQNAALLKELDTLDQLARRNAGDIQGAMHKIRGPCSGQMSSETKYSLLHTAVVHGRSTLNEMKNLVKEIGCVEDTVIGIASLSAALAEACLPLKELEATLQQRNKKSRAKGFKAHISSLLDDNSVASWIESVDSSELECLGGDANRLYQLLVENKKSSLDMATLKTASSRDDLFSKKQIKTLKKLCREEANVLAMAMDSKTSTTPVRGATDKVPTIELERKCTLVSESNPSARPLCESQPVSNAERSKSTSTKAHADHTATSCIHFLLLTFIKGQKTNIKGSPESFCQWLASEDIVSLEDLADAVSDADYLSVLQKGDGTVGVKGFRREVFKKAALVAASTANDINARPTSCEDKENALSPSKTASGFSFVQKPLSNMLR